MLHHFDWVNLPVHDRPPFFGGVAIILARALRPTVQLLTIAPRHGAQLDHLPHLQLALILTENRKKYLSDKTFNTVHIITYLALVVGVWVWGYSHL